MYGVVEFEGGGFHYMESLQYVLKPKSLRELKKSGVPEDLIMKLKPLKDEQFKTLVDFTEQLEIVLGKEAAASYHSVILMNSETTGCFNKEGYVEFLKQVMGRFKALAE